MVLDGRMRWMTASLAAVPLLLAACGSVAPGSGGTTGPQAPASVVAGDRDNGRTVSVRVGGQVQLVLASTYWTVQGSSNPAVLRETAQPVVSPSPAGCVPGQGCGTVSVSFDAVAAGQADVTASRSTCGEALACQGTAGAYRVTVLVTP